MNSKIAMSALSILASLAIMGGATFAFFSDSGTSSGNVFAAGNLNLQLDDTNETVTENVTASFGTGVTPLSPGGSVTGYVSFHNAGNIDIAEIKIGSNLDVNGGGVDGSNLADVLNLTVLTGDDTACSTGQVDQTSTINALIGGGGGNPVLTLTELNNNDYDSLPGVSVGPDKFVCVTFTMDSTAGNQYQGDSITETFTFEAHQNASQT